MISFHLPSPTKLHREHSGAIIPIPRPLRSRRDPSGAVIAARLHDQMKQYLPASRCGPLTSRPPQNPGRQWIGSRIRLRRTACRSSTAMNALIHGFDPDPAFAALATLDRAEPRAVGSIFSESPDDLDHHRTHVHHPISGAIRSPASHSATAPASGARS